MVTEDTNEPVNSEVDMEELKRTRPFFYYFVIVFQIGIALGFFVLFILILNRPFSFSNTYFFPFIFIIMIAVDILIIAYGAIIRDLNTFLFVGVYNIFTLLVSVNSFFIPLLFSKFSLIVILFLLGVNLLFLFLGSIVLSSLMEIYKPKPKENPG